MDLSVCSLRVGAEGMSATGLQPHAIFGRKLPARLRSRSQRTTDTHSPLLSLARTDGRIGAHAEPEPSPTHAKPGRRPFHPPSSRIDSNRSIRIDSNRCHPDRESKHEAKVSQSQPKRQRKNARPMTQYNSLFLLSTTLHCTRACPIRSREEARGPLRHVPDAPATPAAAGAARRRRRGGDGAARLL